MDLQGRRIVVFVVGGITRSEMRVAHLMSKKLGRDVVLGGTSVDDPEIFLGNLLVIHISMRRTLFGLHSVIVTEECGQCKPQHADMLACVQWGLPKYRLSGLT